ncbi:MAG TPA: MerR family transcriptional regulator [Ktedonobacteraceae bacterium]
MQENTSHFTIEELAEQVGLSIRTVRYYITEGLLPGPQGRGKATTYGDEHLQRLRLIRLLSLQHRPLAEIHQLLDHLSLSEIHTLLAEEEQRARELESEGQAQQPQAYIATLLKNAQATRLSLASQSAPSAPVASPGTPPSPLPGQRVRENTQGYGNVSAPAPATASWRRLELAPGIELHIREGAEEQQRALLERICKAAGVSFRK